MKEANNGNEITAAVDAVPLNLCPLEEQELAVLAEIDQQEQYLAQQMAGQRIGLIRLVMKQKRLEGVWGLSDDRKALVRKQ
jgi:hypothetical protein